MTLAACMFAKFWVWLMVRARDLGLNHGDSLQPNTSKFKRPCLGRAWVTLLESLHDKDVNLLNPLVSVTLLFVLYISYLEPSIHQKNENVG